MNKNRLNNDTRFPLIVSEKQALVILEPWEAPENFYCDGEISHGKALELWKERLKNTGFDGFEIKICEKYIFE